MADELQPDEAPMPRAEYDLAIIAEHSRSDGYLQSLVGLAEDDLPAAVGLLVNGMVVFGSIVSPRAMAEAMDA
jgi:hypothetical protein